MLGVKTMANGSWNVSVNVPKNTVFLDAKDCVEMVAPADIKIGQ